MKYIVIELQKIKEDTDISTLVSTKNTKEEAESTYYSILASAAISKIPVHGAIIIDELCNPLKNNHYTHNAKQEDEQTAPND